MVFLISLQSGMCNSSGVVVLASAAVTENSVAYPQKKSYNYGDHTMIKHGELIVMII